MALREHCQVDAYVGQLHVKPVAIVPAHDPPAGSAELAGQVGMRQYLRREQGCTRSFHWCVTWAGLAKHADPVLHL